jgi:hypothetical protein
LIRNFATAAVVVSLTHTMPVHAAAITWNVNAVTDSGLGSLAPFQSQGDTITGFFDWDTV